MKIRDTWKEANLVNLLAPLSVKIRFQHNNLKEMDKLKNTLARINIIDDYVLEEFDILSSHLGFKFIYERGSFSGGACKVKEKKYIVLNKNKPD